MTLRQPLTTVVDGRRWNLYSVDFESPDGRFSVFLYAISDEHAELQCEALRETARVSTRVEGIYG